MTKLLFSGLPPKLSTYSGWLMYFPPLLPKIRFYELFKIYINITIVLYCLLKLNKTLTLQYQTDMLKPTE